MKDKRSLTYRDGERILVRKQEVFPDEPDSKLVCMGRYAKHRRSTERTSSCTRCGKPVDEED